MKKLFILSVLNAVMFAETIRQVDFLFVNAVNMKIPLLCLRLITRCLKIELTGKDPDAKCYESLREKYVYNNEHFSKKAYNDMLAYADEKFKKEYAEWVRSNNPGKIECPVCHTISGKKISVGAKAVSVGLFGIFSQKVKKTWHCEICGYEW